MALLLLLRLPTWPNRPPVHFPRPGASVALAKAPDVTSAPRQVVEEREWTFPPERVTAQRLVSLNRPSSIQRGVMINDSRAKNFISSGGSLLFKRLSLPATPRFALPGELNAPACLLDGVFPRTVKMMLEGALNLISLEKLREQMRVIA